MDILQCYWGKADKQLNYHLLVYHSLDVVAVAKAYLEARPDLLNWFAKQLKLDKDICLRLILFFVAIHDLGKFSQTFQNQIPKIFNPLNPESTRPIHAYDIRHDCLGLLFWRCKGYEQFFKYGFLEESQKEACLDVFEYWVKAVTGHHGQPTVANNNFNTKRFLQYFSEQDQWAALQFMDFAAKHFLRDITCLPMIDPDTFIDATKRVSWWLSGLTILADWIGSDQALFNYSTTHLGLDEYWHTAYQIAKHAILVKGVTPAILIQGQSFFDLFDKKTPTPLQQKVSELPLSAEPQLFILEDVTGAGKTEAALMLAYRLMTQGKGQGFYIGLPTMATANAMYLRMQDAYQRFFQANTASLVLAHGKSKVMKQFKQTITEDFNSEFETQQDQLETASSRCHAWLADNRKKALLADIGIGTLDQSLQAILPNKHQSLRLLGLFGKILMVDEVHAYDSYMLRLLENVLRFHLASGGSTILLSATLPANIRYRLLQTYTAKKNTELTKQVYPLLTHAWANNLLEYPVATRKEVMRTVVVNMSDNYNQVEQIILTALEQGQCVCWIRNTVYDAIESYTRLARQLSGENLLLFHARFTLADRLTIENKILDTFGAQSTIEQRQGKCVIATQVIEQSLDIDFDFMVTDLAPIDLIIQRAGRLQRHKRAGRDETQPALLIYGPEPVTEPKADWLANFFPKSKSVYENHAQLWLTAKLLQTKGQFTMPDDARDLIEGVYGDPAEDIIPEYLQQNASRADGKDKAEASLAYWSALNLDNGYDKEYAANWLDEVFSPTRLGEKTVTLRLATWQDDRLSPWHTDLEQPWLMSEITVSANLIQQRAELLDATLCAAVEQAERQLPDKGKWSILLPLEYDMVKDCWVGSAVNRKGQIAKLHYSHLFGLQM